MGIAEFTRKGRRCGNGIGIPSYGLESSAESSGSKTPTLSLSVSATVQSAKYVSLSRIGDPTMASVIGTSAAQPKMGLQDNASLKRPYRPVAYLRAFQAYNSSELRLLPRSVQRWVPCLDNTCDPAASGFGTAYISDRKKLPNFGGQAAL